MDETAEGTSTGALMMAIGAVIALAVLGMIGKGLYDYFQHFDNCLNGC